ncbi:hypothetical protein MLD38_003628 [Melastoma candidum]|uniref:Uncharacterized protein n=1 Tax=Melastoma candidum TaxID=119954 RepID=A0ACB9SBQ4_9MYRT|nr:hypothetical protein MLD38_003628 [Melastoma candidum]
MESARRTLATAAGVGVRRRRPLSDCTNSVVPEDSSSTSSVSLLRKVPLHLLRSSVDGAGAGAAGGDLESAAQHNRHHAVKRKCPAVTMMTAAPAIGDSLGSLDDAKNCDLSSAMFLPDKRKQRVRGGGRARKASDQDLEDYIRQQRVYFAEVDAFELEEEEVGEVEGLD